MRYRTLLIAISVAACDGSSTGVDSTPLTVEVTGRAERGSVVRLRVAELGVALPPGAATLTFAPSDAVQPLGGDSVRLLRAGTVTIRAAAPDAEGTHALAVAVPPAIVFDRIVDSNRDLWRVELDGGGLTRLTDDPASDSDPSVAAGQVVFVSLRADANAELFRLPLAGGPAARITRTSADETMPALSRDGQRLAYVSNAGGVDKLWLAGADGSGAARASTFGGGSGIDASPSWDQGSTRLVFSSSAEGSPDVYLFTPPSTPALLAGGGSVDVDPAFSPDGQHVVFASSRAGGSATNLYLESVPGGTVTLLTTSAATQGQPTWTADGRVVFTEFGPNGGSLRWVDPAAPAIVHTIDTGAGSARNPAGVP